MNVNNFSHSASTSRNPVTSKYFSNEAALDESLTEFQEKKKVIGPKNLNKNVPKRRNQKRIKGQKDIRSLIKEKNNLIEYSKNFNNICKKSGVDIDSEQLQLAIALSKSLHEPKQTLNDTEVSKTLTSRERTNKIRTTLQEYGFKVPVVKAAALNKKKQKRYNLLTTSDEEKQQIISAKYSKILSKNCYNVIIFETNLQKESIFYKSTSMLYEDMKNSDVFYVTGLIEKSLTSINLLRDWSDIPGRCPSPVLEGPHIGFNDIRCSQDELDILLSGCFAYTQKICQVKLRTTFQIEKLSDETCHESEQAISSKILANETLLLSTSTELNNLDIKEVDVLNRDNEENYIVNETLSQPISMVTEYLDSKPDFHHKTDVLGISKSLNATTGSPTRCVSPDLFDEEVSTIFNMSSELSKPLDKYDTIDLTQCVPSNIKAQVSNETKRLSNDIMELTKCIGTAFNNDDKIDLTQEFNDDDSTIVYVDENVSCRKGSLKNLTCEEVSTIDKEHIVDLVAINSDSVADVVEQNTQTIDTMNITQSSDSCDSLPDINLGGDDRNHTMENINVKSNNTLYEKVVDEVPDFTSTDLKSNKKTTDLSSSNIINLLKEDDGNDHQIDLTQSQEYNYCVNNISDSSNIDNLGKKDNLSVDYDDMIDDDDDFVEIIESSSSSTKSTNNPNKYITTEKSLSFSKGEEPASDSESGRLYVQELNYSVKSYDHNFEELPSIDMNCQNNSVESKILTPVKNKNFEIIKTPSNNEYIIKTVDVTPMQNFEAMSSPERNEELEKYGLKPFKRKRAIQLLTYIYNQTHPVVESCDNGSPSKKVKLNSPQKIISSDSSQSPRKSQKLTRKSIIFDKNIEKSPAKFNDMDDKDNIYIQTDDTPSIKDIACEPEDWVFQKREKAKVHSCRVPLHIAFHNYVSCRRLLREAILCYEPINIDVVHKDLVAAGYRYNPKDLLKFMDKKCITVKTADNNTRNKR